MWSDVRLRVALIAAVCLLLSGAVLAQGGFISYGQVVAGNLSDTSPVALHTFQGNSGDLIAVEVSATSGGLDPTVTLLSPGGVPLANNDNDPFSFNLGDAGLRFQLPETGIYSLLVGGANNTRGDFMLRLILRSSSAAPVPLAGTAQIDLATGPQAVLVAGDPSGVTPVTIQAAPVEAAFSVEVRQPSGQTIAIFINVSNANLLLPAAAGNYVVVISPSAPGVQGIVSISEAMEAVNLPAPVATEEALPSSAVPPANVCSTSPASGAVNVRSGPGTNFGVVATLQQGQYLVVTGQNAGWFAVTLPGGGLGWVAGSVVTLYGPCDNIPLVQGPAIQPTVPPNVVVTVTPSPTAAVGGQQPTLAPTQPPPTLAPTQAPPTAPPTQAAQIAPPDNNYVLVVPLDGSASLSDYVSHPNGDVEDVVSYDTTGLNPNQALPGGRGQLSIALVCSGTGTNFITFRIDGQNFSCGQTFLRTVNADSDTGAVRITATNSGPEGTYVQWTLNATLTRLN
jgi:uncharacterized protein YraI